MMHQYVKEYEEYHNNENNRYLNEGANKNRQMMNNGTQMGKNYKNTR